ncbi:MAG: hypothetical protein AAF480_03665 [Actinomycetota bacterium]
MSDQRDDGTGEDELRRLLGGADRPRSLRGDELARIRDKVDGLADSTTPAKAAGHVEIPSHAAGPAPSPLRGRLMGLAVAAAIVVIGLVVFSGGESDDDVSVAEDPEALIQTPLEQTCTREIARLANAIDAWDGIGNWALTQNGEPALDDLAADALLALARIEGLEVGAAEALGALDEEMAAATEVLQAQARSARTAAVTTASQAILDLVEGHPGGGDCELSRLAGRLDG